MRYFFDVHNGNELTRDEVGMELEGINQARDEAAEALAKWRAVHRVTRTLAILPSRFGTSSASRS